jgi:hypothetical protein
MLRLNGNWLLESIKNLVSKIQVIATKIDLIGTLEYMSYFEDNLVFGHILYSVRP